MLISSLHALTELPNASLRDIVNALMIPTVARDSGESTECNSEIAQQVLAGAIETYCVRDDAEL